MKQILQSLKDGQTEIVDVPVPKATAGHVLICSSKTLISAGTERMLLEFGRANWVEKARQQPDKVRMVLDKVRTDGLASTFEAVQSKLDQPLPLGYCNVGIVGELGKGVEEFSVGDRVVSNGKHAEVVCVPKNLCARVPEGVSDEQAAFTVLAAIGLQGIRLANPTLGECVVVTGLGLIGLLTVQMLLAQGCRVLGVDFDETRLSVAQGFGADVVNAASGADVLAAAAAFSRGRGVDAVILTVASGSNEPMRQAAAMCRKRGRIVLVGVTGLELSRADFYEKELTFQVSCSYGPGRYDPKYEERGQDYPVAFVRWTEQRNFEAVLDLLAAGRLNVESLITHRFALSDAAKAYELLASGQPSLGVLLNYPAGGEGEGEPVSHERTVLLRERVAPDVPLARPRAARASTAFLGAGNYAGQVLIPAFQAAGAHLHTVVSAGGVSAAHFGRKFGFIQASTDWESAIADAAIDTVVIATRHDAHARQVLAALEAGRHVFCEKPLCLTLEAWDEIRGRAGKSAEQLLMVGFNRRFAPHVVRMRELLAPIDEPKSLMMTVNAGAIPLEHWTQDKEVGGGRIVGEACHFIDLLRHLAGSSIVRTHAVALGRHPALETTEDKAVLTLEFADGSVGTIHYLANGEKGFPKERLEVFAAGRILQLDNFRTLRGWGWPKFSKYHLMRQDKGQRACAKAFVDAVRLGQPAPIPVEEILEVSRVSIELQKALGDASS